MKRVLAEIVRRVAVIEAVAQVTLPVGHAGRTVLAIPREESRLLLVDVVEPKGESMRERGNRREVQGYTTGPPCCIAVGLHLLDVGDRHPRLTKRPLRGCAARIAVHGVAKKSRPVVACLLLGNGVAR